MTYEEIVKKVEKEFGSADVSNYEGHLALQINITGEGAGIFYAEISEGKLYIAPFDYKDNDAAITADSSDVVDVFSGKTTIADALEAGKLSVEGDLAKALSIQPYINVKTVKTTAKKTAAKKSAEPKLEVKTEIADTVKKPAKKTAAKTASKAAAKTAAKPATKSAAKATKKSAAGNSKG